VQTPLKFAPDQHHGSIDIVATFPYTSFVFLLYCSHELASCQYIGPMVRFFLCWLFGGWFVPSKS
jgi:hypothetical protein